MKHVLGMFVVLLVITSSGVAAVWNSPQDGATVGSPTYMDCTAPISNPAYMKLWVDGVAVLTVHNTNRMAFVAQLALGSRRINCQYNDGVNPTFDNVINVQAASNVYDKVDLDEDPNGSAPNWEEADGCSSPCTSPIHDSNTDTATSLDGRSRYFTATRDSNGGSFQDVYWFEKRCTAVSLASRWVMQFDLEVSSNQPRALEIGVTQFSGSTRYRLAYQANSADNVWKMYDPSGSGWLTTNIPFNYANDFPAGFHRVYLVGHPGVVSGQNVVIPDAIQIDSSAAKVVTTPAYANTTAPGSACGEYNSESVQIDLDTSHTSNKIWMDNLEIHFQP